MITRFSLFTLLIFTVFACKTDPKSNNKKTESPKVVAKPTTPFKAINKDSIYGVKGAEKASMVATSPAFTEFTYQNYKVRTEQTKEGTGEVIRIFDKAGKEIVFDANDQFCFFHGIAFDNMFVDKGTGPDGRILKIYDLKQKKLSYQGTYCDEMTVYETGALWFFAPIKEELVKKKPFCNSGEDWVKQGLSIGYAQRKLYDLRSGAVISKSEYKCVPLQ
jgi:hypothetical protein